ncbi:MAG: RT0821/Lpp0805 family surface protein [Gammaproteobacteria bacterium]|jgi:surface antigen
MVKTATHTAAICLAAALACGCASDMGEKQTLGGLLGAAGGGLLGSQFGHGSGQLAATAAGTLLGALVGSNIGRTMDDVDRLKAQQAYEHAARAPIGETITWENPNTEHSGSITPVREGTSSSGLYCREFQQTVSIGGKSERAYGTACRQPDGSWKMVQG